VAARYRHRESGHSVPDLALPSPTKLLRSTDPEDTGVWQIPTWEGLVIGRLHPDGRGLWAHASRVGSQIMRPPASAGMVVKPGH
jgi:hypothetical protein